MIDQSIVNLLIEKWSNDPELQSGVPYRRMSSEAAEIMSDKLEASFDLIEMAFVQFAHCDDDGWYDTMSLSTLRDLGEYLVDAGTWERREGGVGRRQFYRQKVISTAHENQESTIG